jgi:HK97 family phage portal protein
MPAATPTLLARMKGFLTNLIGAEGSWRGPFFGMGPYGGVFELGRWEDGFQRGLTISGYEGRMIPAAYAAVMANARAVSQCYACHKSVDDDGDVSVVATSPASRVLLKPNSSETWPQFILNMVAAMQFEGAAFAVALRDNRGAINALWRMPFGRCQPYVAEDGSVFYATGENPLIPDAIEAMVPARDVLHLRAYTPRHPLLGESPIAAASMAAGVNVALSQSQLAFFSRMNRPSGGLQTDQALSSAAIATLREKFDEQSRGMNQGGLPILSHGLKFQSFAINSQDAQLIEAQRLSIEDIARVYGVPLPVIGDLTHATLQNVEQLVNMWLAISLGSLLENIERSLDDLFGLGGEAAGDYVELDTRALLRTDFAGRIDATCKAIQGGLMTPNEAREREGLSPVANGDTPYMQQQMVPLGYKPPAPAPAPAPAAAPAANADSGAEPDTGDAGEGAEPPEPPAPKDFEAVSRGAEAILRQACAEFEAAPCGTMLH